jgi:hypothetical protein
MNLNTINLVLGDWSGDGHEKTASIMISTNLSRQEIVDAYAAGTLIVGFDFSHEVCCEYEDHVIPHEKINKLIELGLQWDVDMFDAASSSDEECYLTHETYVLIYCFIVSLGREGFRYELCKNNDIHIGGYGLFY